MNTRQVCSLSDVKTHLAAPVSDLQGQDLVASLLLVDERPRTAVLKDGHVLLVPRTPYGHLPAVKITKAK